MNRRITRKTLFTSLGGALLLSAALFYLWPVGQVPFEALYAEVNHKQKRSLLNFRNAHPVRALTVNGDTWNYLVVGSSHRCVLFLHGMTGAPDIWFQQIDSMASQFRCISITYPPVGSLLEMAEGIIAILDHEAVKQCAVAGSSLGGYVAQYLVQKYPARFSHAVFVNTFPPNPDIERENRMKARLMVVSPPWLVLRYVRQNVDQTLVPAANDDPLTRTFLLEMTYGRMNKAQFLARYQCIIEPFETKSVRCPVLIVESDNDPLVKSNLRQKLKCLYPHAQIYTFYGAGRFPYLNEPARFN